MEEAAVMQTAPWQRMRIIRKSTHSAGFRREVNPLCSARRSAGQQLPGSRSPPPDPEDIKMRILSGIQAARAAVGTAGNRPVAPGSTFRVLQADQRDGGKHTLGNDFLQALRATVKWTVSV